MKEDLGLPLPEDTWTSVLNLVHHTSLCAHQAFSFICIGHAPGISQMLKVKMLPKPLIALFGVTGGEEKRFLLDRYPLSSGSLGSPSEVEGPHFTDTCRRVGRHFVLPGGKKKKKSNTLSKI